MNKIRKGDEVVILTGRDKKRRGTVIDRVDADHVLVNRDFAATLAAVRAILQASRSAVHRQRGMAGLVDGLIAG